MRSTTLAGDSIALQMWLLYMTAFGPFVSGYRVLHFQIRIFLVLLHYLCPEPFSYSSVSLGWSLHFHYFTTSLILYHFNYFTTSTIHSSIFLSQSGLVSPFSLHYYLTNTLPFSLLHYLTYTLFNTHQPVWPGLSIFTTLLSH